MLRCFMIIFDELGLGLSYVLWTTLNYFLTHNPIFKLKQGERVGPIVHSIVLIHIQIETTKRNKTLLVTLLSKNCTLF